MLGWQEVGYRGLDRKASPQWKGIMEHVEQRIDKLAIVKSEEMDVDQKIRDAVALYGNEGIQWHRDAMATPDGAEYQPAAPWS
jgi:hypothetical protein